jgi:rsbT co-antagonist protein RsbR
MCIHLHNGNFYLNKKIGFSSTETILAYEQYTDSLMKKRQEEIDELSSPIVPIQDGIAILPLVGSISPERAENIMNKAVPKVSQLKTECLIIDFSGIVTIDTEVASHIFNIYNVLRLLGINAIITGLRPELASRVVTAGIDFSSIKTFANVQQAIESLV